MDDAVSEKIVMTSAIRSLYKLVVSTSLLSNENGNTPTLDSEEVVRDEQQQQQQNQSSVDNADTTTIATTTNNTSSSPVAPPTEALVPSVGGTTGASVGATTGASVGGATGAASVGPICSKKRRKLKNIFKKTFGK